MLRTAPSSSPTSPRQNTSTSPVHQQASSGRLHPAAQAYCRSHPPTHVKLCPRTGTEFEDRLLPLMENIVKEGERKTGIKVSRGKNGCFFSGNQEDMPDGWCY